MSLYSDPTFLKWFASIWAFLAIATCWLSLRITAPYGRHFRSGWGPTLPNMAGWIIMELPALLIVPAMFLLSGSKENLHLFLTLMWLLHYVHRTLVFPLLIRTRGKRMPLSIVFMAVVFNVINGLLVSGVFWTTPQDLIWLVLMGMAIFLMGMYINIKADYSLISLRKKSASGEYRIPKGFLFEKVSCPNHFGEILEWSGFAIMAWHSGALLFLIWTVANLLPRAISHHQWYKTRFPEYPASRKALIPYLL